MGEAGVQFGDILVAAGKESAQRAAHIRRFALECMGSDGNRSGFVAVLQDGDMEIALAIQGDHAADATDAAEDLCTRRVDFQYLGLGAADGGRGRRGKRADHVIGSRLASDDNVSRRIHQNAVQAWSGSESWNHVGSAPTKVE